MSDRAILIVEDDATIASIHKRLILRHPGFTVTAVVPSAERAMSLMRRGVKVDLILLDISLPGANGDELLRALRAGGGPEVIVVTASRDPAMVRRLLNLGVVDYLIKPFTPERLQQALVRYRERMRTLSAEHLTQQEIDGLSMRNRSTLLPKGIRPDTLRVVRAALSSFEGQPVSAGTVAATAAIARVTARRYLEYLLAAGQATVDTCVEGPGRPQKLYSASGGGQ
jgi:response regulator of citrate/malate metabolism